MTLNDYYCTLPERTWEAPKTIFVRNVARKCGVSETTVRSWIGGHTMPSPENRTNIEHIVGAELEWEEWK